MSHFPSPPIFRRAIVRRPGPLCGRGLTSSGLGPPDPALLLRQHEAYVAALRRLGLEIIELPSEPGYPDGYFVEDTAVVTPRVAVVTRPGAASRRGEEETIAPVLARYRPVVRIESPGTVEGGDVLEAAGRFFIGVSERTNEHGARQLGRHLEACGHPWTLLPVAAGLHLKSSVNDLGHGTIILTAGLSPLEAFRSFRRIILEPQEEYAANVLRINGHLLMPFGFPAVRRKLEALGLPLLELEVGEIRKMDGGLTCLSLRF
jgi:dimethylargininase